MKPKTKKKAKKKRCIACGKKRPAKGHWYGYDKMLCQVCMESCLE